MSDSTTINSRSPNRVTNNDYKINPVNDNRAFFAHRQSFPNIVGYRSNGVPVLVDENRGGFYSRLRKTPDIVDNSINDLALSFPKAQVFRSNAIDDASSLLQRQPAFSLSSDGRTFDKMNSIHNDKGRF